MLTGFKAKYSINLIKKSNEIPRFDNKGFIMPYLITKLWIAFALTFHYFTQIQIEIDKNKVKLNSRRKRET